MVIINHLLILFIFTTFAHTTALKTLGNRPSFSLIQEETTALQRYEVLVEKHPTATAIFELFQISLSQTSFSEGEKDQILFAALLAAEKYQGRLSQDPYHIPYVVYPLGVASQLIESARVRDVAAIQAALLYAAVEDGHLSFEELNSQFGKTVRQYVIEVIDAIQDSKMSIVHALELSQSASLIVLADKFYKVREIKLNPSLKGSQEERNAYIEQATEIVNNLPSHDPKLKAKFDQLVYANP